MVHLSRPPMIEVIAPVAPPPVAASLPALTVAPKVEAPLADEKSNKGATAAAVPTIRVDLDRVDRMIDLVGELVINQAMLAQRVFESGLARSINRSYRPR